MGSVVGGSGRSCQSGAGGSDVDVLIRAEDLMVICVAVGICRVVYQCVIVGLDLASEHYCRLPILVMFGRKLLPDEEASVGTFFGCRPALLKRMDLK